jgi:hypothetical protein
MVLVSAAVTSFPPNKSQTLWSDLPFSDVSRCGVGT